MTPTIPDGILLVDKPAGQTSHDVVLTARRATGERRIGHGGTLDPFATGLLVLLLGRATRLLPHIDADPKVYDATIVFGAETDTEDAGGTVIREAGLPSRRDVLDAAAQLTGDVMQVPSAFSAKRVGGRRAYAVARKGDAPVLAPVRVRIDAWDSLAWRGSEAGVTEWDVRVTCGGGTYIRALARDLARAAGSAAHLRALRRVRSGAFDVANATSMADLTSDRWESLSPLAALPHLPRVAIDDAAIACVVRGVSIPAAGDAPGDAGWGALVGAESGVLVALAQRRAGEWQPRVVMRPATTTADAEAGAAGRPS
jgi:tRNA pseudouridine55 synthase